jgi:hypothetical protein
MKAKNLLMLVIVLTLAVVAVAFGSRTQLAYQSFGFGGIAQERTTESRIPDYVLYDKLFRMVNSLKKKSESGKIEIERADALSGYFKQRANLTGEENQILQNTALEFITEVAPIDARAGVVITEARRNLSNRVAGEERTPPAELVNLQEQRNALALSYRDRLKESLGADAFTRFEEFVQGDFASGFQAIPLSAINFAEQR